MNRLNRFEHHRYVGIRKNMKVYDCDDEKQFESLNEYLKDYDYVSLNLVQSFSPDNIDEAKIEVLDLLNNFPIYGIIFIFLLNSSLIF